MTDGEMSPLRAAAVQAHELYVELKNAGFSRGEAIELLAKTLASGIGEATQQRTEDD